MICLTLSCVLLESCVVRHSLLLGVGTTLAVPAPRQTRSRRPSVHAPRW